MKKITTEDLLNSSTALAKPGAAEENLLLFAGEQPELREYILEISEDSGDEDELSDHEQAFLEQISLNLWHALKAGGFVPPPAERQAVYALEKQNFELLDTYIEKAKKTRKLCRRPAVFPGRPSAARTDPRHAAYGAEPGGESKG